MTIGTPVTIKYPEMDEQATGEYVTKMGTFDLIRLDGTGQVLPIPNVYVEELGHKGRSWRGR